MKQTILRINQEDTAIASTLTPNSEPLILIKKDFLSSSKVQDPVHMKEEMDLQIATNTHFQGTQQKEEEFLTNKPVLQVNFGDLQTLQVLQTTMCQSSLVGRPSF